MNTLQISHILRHVKHFNGVYSADRLTDLVDTIEKNFNQQKTQKKQKRRKQQQQQPTCFISNTKPSNHPGEHWVLIYVPPPAQTQPHGNNNKNNNMSGPIEFFDSFGYRRRTSFLHSVMFRRFITKLKKKIALSDNDDGLKIKTNIAQIQSASSDLCGHYCVVYAILRLQPQTTTCRPLTMAQILNRMVVSSTEFENNDLHILHGLKRLLHAPPSRCKKQQRKQQHRQENTQCCKPMNKCKNVT